MFYLMFYLMFCLIFCLLFYLQLKRLKRLLCHIIGVSVILTIIAGSGNSGSSVQEVESNNEL